MHKGRTCVTKRKVTVIQPIRFSKTSSRLLQGKSYTLQSGKQELNRYAMTWDSLLSMKKPKYEQLLGFPQRTLVL